MADEKLPKDEDIIKRARYVSRGEYEDTLEATQQHIAGLWRQLELIKLALPHINFDKIDV